MVKHGIQQGLRSPRKLIAYFLVVALTCAFLCIGLNLKKTADDNLSIILDSFNVVAVPDFKANINEQGRLTASQRDRIGVFPCKAENYEISKLQELPGAIQVDARNQFGACVNGQNGLLYQKRCTSQTALRYNGMDVVIFQLDSSTPITLLGYQKQQTYSGEIWIAEQVKIPIKLIWAASGRTELTSLNVQNPSFDHVYYLEPGKTYIINMGAGGDLTSDIYHQAYPVQVSARGAYSMNQAADAERKVNHPAIAEYYEGFWDTDFGMYFQQSAEACYLAGNSLTAITTDNLSMIPSWASGDIYLRNGRLFSEEDYQNGNRVCIISQHLLEVMDWKIGDTVDLSFYETSYILSPTIKNQFSTFDPFLYASKESVVTGNDKTLPLEHIFDENTYTIIGTYDGKVCWRDEHESYQFNESMHWLMALLPKASVQNQPIPKLSQYHTTISIEPLMIQKFLAAVQSAGLMDEQPYGYQLGLTINDHGLSEMISGLESLQQISRLTLMLASITAALAVLVLAILHLLQNRRQIAILRSMGVRKGQVTTCILAGILLVCVIGAALGAWCGEKLSETVVQNILDNAQEETFDSSFSAMLAADDDEADDFQFSAAADPRLTYWTAGMVSAAMILVSSALVFWEAKKPPLLMLGVKE